MIPRARIGADIRHSLAGGFVLIGVVMFVLALTILGISLFGLSSYEAQFYERSRDDAQAFYSALGGIDRAKFVLQRQKHYEDVMLNLPLGDIVYARARVAQSYAGGPAVGDTTGIVDFSGNTRVEIRVLAIHNGERSMVEQTFVPQLPQAIYHRLITAYNGVKVIQPGQAFIDGEVHQFVADTSWTVAPVDAGYQRLVYANENVPHPNAASYIANWLGGANTNVPPFGVNHQYNLAQGSHFYTTPGTVSGSSFGDGYSAYVDGNPPFGPAINVTGEGYAIWLLPHGFRSDQTITVQGGPTDLLIIVAQDALPPNQKDAAINLLGGLNSPVVPVILVSDSVDVEQQNAGPNSYTVSWLSIFADHVLLGGADPGFHTSFKHPLGPAAVDPLIDDLYDLGLLPNSGAGPAARFVTVRRSWRQVTESDPN